MGAEWGCIGVIRSIAAIASISPVIIRQAPNPDINSDDDSDDLVTGVLTWLSNGGVQIQQETALGGTVISSATPWSSLSPFETDGANWVFRIRHTAGVNSFSSGSALNTWHTLNSNHSLTFTTQNSGPDVVAGNYTSEISNDGGSTVFDGPNTFTVTLENLSP